jgi:hypothetical protein
MFTLEKATESMNIRQGWLRRNRCPLSWGKMARHTEVRSLLTPANDLGRAQLAGAGQTRAEPTDCQQTPCNQQFARIANGKYSRQPFCYAGQYNSMLALSSERRYNSERYDKATRIADCATMQAGTFFETRR